MPQAEQAQGRRPLATGAPGAQGETQASPASTRRGKSGEYQNVIFGKQAKPAEAGEGGEPEGQQRSSDAGSDNKPDASTTSNTLEAKRRAFQDLVNGEYKDIYTEETQRIIDRRFRETQKPGAAGGPVSACH